MLKTEQGLKVNCKERTTCTNSSEVEPDLCEDQDQQCSINICYSPVGRSVLGKTVPEVSSTARGRRPRAELETEGTVFPNTDRPRPVNNIFIYF